MTDETVPAPDDAIEPDAAKADVLHKFDEETGTDPEDAQATDGP